MSIFDASIAEMQKAPHLLTPKNLEALKDLAPLPHAPDSITDTGNLLEMGKVMRKLVQVAERMYTDALTTTGDDAAGDMKAAANALKQAMDVAIRYTDKINASDRAIKVENALVAAIQEFAQEEELPELTRRFNEKLKRMLNET